jgi:hypothetical protein
MDAPLTSVPATFRVQSLTLIAPVCGAWQMPLRASANRSRSAGRSSLPTVVGPGPSDEPTHDNDHLGEGDPKVDDLAPAFGAPE